MTVEPSTTPAALAEAMSAGEAPSPTDVVSARPVPWLEAWVAVLCLAAIIATAGVMLGGGRANGLFLPAVCLGLAALAAGFDAATGRIPNPITYTGILLGLALNCLGPALQSAAPKLVSQWLGAAGPTQSLLGLLVFGGIGMIGLLFAGMGGGDMKLLAAIGAVLGLSRATDALMVGGAVAVVYALVNLAIAGRLNATLRLAATHALILFYLKERSPIPAAAASRRTIPLAIPLLAGLLLSRVPTVATAVGWLTNPS